MPTAYINGSFPASGFEQITVAGTAIGFTTAQLVVVSTTNAGEGGTSYTSTKTAFEAYITNETNEIRWTCDGTTPTSTVGHVLAAGSGLMLTGYQNLKNFRAIRTGSSATLSVTFFRK